MFYSNNLIAIVFRCFDCTVHKSVYVKYYDVEEQLLSILRDKIKLDPEKLKEEIENQLIEQKKESSKFNKQNTLDSFLNEKQSLLDSIDRLFDQESKGTILPQIFERQLQNRQNELLEIEERIKSIENEIEIESKKDKSEINPLQVKENINGILDVYNQLQKSEKK